MSENAIDRHSHTADRPADVTDPLLWRLALDVADAHAPGEDGGCTHLLCAGQNWPCEPWQQAQRALNLAQGGNADETTAPAADRHDTWAAPSAQPNWSTDSSRRQSAAA
ncbi:hypothetical protein ACFFMR_22830 [Micromonospora andamanensis]|uniref:Uncharacterized protein n=1 Tax=Micromonospora andamanensis TaxID=1287068 RepID=A0ABQ4I3W7_9ACTN|nr:hypothetical protein [Micromonospora andamanensis]GIJ12573.1 hypothetical protein Van01_57870 [Micromonospora andamanensis]